MASTRTGEANDFALDASVYLSARDAETGGRQRGHSVSVASRRRVLGCSDLAPLDASLLAAAVSPSVRALFG